MSTQLYRNQSLLLAKTESTYGTDPTPTQNSNAFLVRNMSIAPMEGTVIDLNYVRPWFGSDGSFRASQYMTCQFETDWVPSPSAAGQPSPFDTLLKACGLSATQVASNITGTAQSASKIVTGTAQSGTVSTIVLAAAVAVADDFFNGTTIRITSGRGAGQIRLITDYVADTKTATLDSNWAITPNSTSVYQIAAFIRLAAGASSTDGIYAGMSVKITEGTALNATRSIVDYYGTYKTAVIAGDWSTAPDATSVYALLSAMNYDPVSTGFGSCTIYYNEGGILHKLLGCRGTVTATLAANELPRLQFSFTGLAGGISDSALSGTPYYGGFGRPTAVNSTNTIGSLFGKTFTGGTSGIQVQSVNFDLGNAVSHRQLVGYEQAVISDRKPKGSIQMEMTTVAFNDWMSNVTNGDTGRLFVEQGTEVGQIVSVNCPKIQLENPRYSDSDGVMMVEFDFRAIWSRGNDEIRFIEK